MNNNEENVDMEEEVILEEASYRLSRSASAALAMGLRHALFNNVSIADTLQDLEFHTIGEQIHVNNFPEEWMTPPDSLLKKDE